MKYSQFVLIIICSTFFVTCNTNESTVSQAEKQATMSIIKNDLKLIQHIVEYAKEDAIETFNNSLPIPQGRFKAKDTTPLRIHDGLTDIDSLIVDIENNLNKIGYE